MLIVHVCLPVFFGVIFYSGLDFKIGLPYEEQYKTPRVVMMKAFDQEDYIKNFKGDFSILQLTARNPSDFVGVSIYNSLLRYMM